MSLKLNYAKIISRKKSLELIKKGWKKADLHVHTFYSNDVLPFKRLDPINLYKKALKKNLSYITFTDHDNMDAYHRIGWKKKKLVTGVELEILDLKNVNHTIHVNVYGLNEDQFNELRQICTNERNIYSLIKYLKKNKLHYVYNHPFWCYNHEELNIDAVFKLAEYFPVIEYNMAIIKPLNKFSLLLAQKYNKGVLSSTDSHIGRIGNIYTLAEGETFDEFFKNIIKNKSYIVTRNMTLKSLVKEIDSRINHLFSRFRFTHHSIDKFTFNEKDKTLDNFVKLIANENIRRNFLIKNIIKGSINVMNRLGMHNIHLKRHYALAKKISQKFDHQ